MQAYSALIKLFIVKYTIQLLINQCSVIEFHQLIKL